MLIILKYFKKYHITRWQYLIILLSFSFSTAIAQAPAKTHVPNKLVAENVFIKKTPDHTIPPTFTSIRDRLPQPIWPNGKDAISAYFKAWEMAFGNLHAVTADNKFVSPYVDAAFNKNLFMWDACFMTMFGRYGHKAFNFQQTLDNFYAKQQRDGFICRQISELNGEERFERFDPISTGPNIFPWAEWEYYLNYNDTDRLKKVFPAMLAYYQWFRSYRSWPDGTYFSSGWGTGMDNQPRVPEGFSFEKSPAFMSWIDITLQQIFAGKTLIKMATILGRPLEVKDIEEEVDQLAIFVNKNMWDAKSSFYYDRYRDGKLSYLKSVGAYWALLADIVPAKDKSSFIAHLANPDEFARRHRVASWAATNAKYDPNGGYWRGAVWSPTTYMVLRGLTKAGSDSLAFEIAKNHHENVIAVFNQTGTFWENYAPDKVQGNNKRDFIGWTALTPITDLFEYVFGLRPDVPHQTLVWDIRLTDEFGVKQYPFGNGLVHLTVKKRNTQTEIPQVSITADVPLKVKVLWNGGSKWLDIKPMKSK